MKIQIHDFRGVADFAADLSGLLILAGPNGAGKSSVCTAIAACLTGNLTPFEGVTKSRAGLLVRDGGAHATATLTGPDGGVAVVWPSCERAEMGRAPWASAVATGLLDPLKMSPRERSAWLIDLMEALPDADATVTALGEAGVSHSEATAIWSGIEARGWDAAHAEAKEAGVKLKGQWERVTGQRYGSAKAAQWRPEGWRSGLDAFDMTELQSAAETAQARVDEARKAALTGEAKRRDAEDAISARQRALSERDSAKDCMIAAREAEAAAQATRDKLGVSAGRMLTCPCCDAALVMIDGSLAQAPEGNADPDAVASADRALAAAHQDYLAKEAHYNRLLAEIEAGNRAEETLADLPVVPDAEAAQRAKEEAAYAATNFDMKRRAVEAGELHEKIGRQVEVVKLLAEDGLRQAALVEALAGLAGELNDVTRAAGWRPVTVDADMSVSYGGRPVSLCSAGEAFRARCAMQIVAARRDGSALVIIDGADILDRDGRNGLMRAVAGVPAVIGMTMKREELPGRLVETGRAVWIGEAPEERRAA